MTPSPILVYLAAPVGAPDAAGVEAHLWDAGRWLKYLVDLPDHVCRRIAWQLPWYAYAANLDDRLGPYRKRGMRDACAALERCDALVAVGGPSPGVMAELELARSLGLPTASLVTVGPQPPPTAVPNWWAMAPHRQVLLDLHHLVAAVDQRRARPCA